MKRLKILIISIVIVVGFICFSNYNSKQQITTQDFNINAEKTVVVYFSASGNTKKIAQYIAEVTKATLFELVPVVPYSTKDLDWEDEKSRVVNEYNHPDNRNIELVNTTVKNWESYDTVFIGYPIWWGTAAWPINHFIKENHFTGKTVIPFCTSISASIGNSGKLLEEAAGTGRWLEGMRFSSKTSKKTIEQWIDSLNL